MAIYQIDSQGVKPLKETSFAAQGLREREDLQRLLKQKIEIRNVFVYSLTDICEIVLPPLRKSQGPLLAESRGRPCSPVLARNGLFRGPAV